MVELAGKHSSTAVNRVASAAGGERGGGSHFDDLLASPEKLSKKRLATELASELWSRLPISRVAEESGDRGIEHTIRIATVSASQVQEWYRELRDFAPAIASAAMDFRGVELTADLLAELATDMQTKMLEQVHYPLPNRSFVDFKFADLPPAEAWSQTHRCIEHACVEFANHVFLFFDTLQQKHLVGQIQETSSTCRFTYFRRVAIAALAGTSTRERSQHNPPAEESATHGFLVEILQLADFEIQHRHAQHVHHVRNPTLNNPSSTIHPLPSKYRGLIDACPDWMSGLIRVLEGELFRDERIEWDLFTETRTAEKVIERVRRDPAVVFGPYILAGWGEDAIKAEENRQLETQNAVARKKTASAARINHVLSYGIAALAILIVTMSASAIGTLTSFGIVVGLVAMGLAGYAAHLASIAKGEVAAKPVMLHSTLVGASVFAIQGFVFSLLHWSLAAFVIGATAAFVAAIAFNANRAATELDESSVG